MRRLLFLITLAVLILMFIPWLGDTLFNTKGEPREAIVAVSMLNSGNYILPESCGGDIPYKPPFLAWLIVASSWLTGGVTEFSARFPSAVATILMAMGGYLFIRRHTETSSDIVAMCSTIVTVTAFEVYRAAANCRTDMVLTACMVGSLYLMYNRWASCKAPGFSIWAVLLMSCAMLTKGPVGVFLPCLVMWAFFLLRGERFWRSTGVLFAMALLSLLLPAAWYVAAAHMGGKEFIDLALEENVGRMTGTMSYESHENPFYYNFITLVAGMLPYTLLVLFSVLAIKRWRGDAGDWWYRFRHMDPVKLFSLVSVVVIVLFYCIPKSKRSVYLLPVYPFLAYFVTLLIMFLVRKKSMTVDFYGLFMALLALLLPSVMIALRYVDLSAYMAAMKPSAAAFVGALQSVPLTWVSWTFISLAFAVGIAAFVVACKSKGKGRLMATALAATVVIYLNLSATILPAVLNTKSDYPIAREINDIQPSGRIFGYINVDMLRFYTAGFYTADRIVPFKSLNDLPATGSALILIGEYDFKDFNAKYGRNLVAESLYTKPLKSCDTGQITTLYRITRR